jgi:putative oxidoreductase
MDIQNLFHYFPPFLDGMRGWGLLILRLVWGVALIFTGWPMVQNPLHWLDLDGKPSGFPGFLQAIGALTIFLGGAATIAGFLTPLTSLGLTGAMAIALAMHLARKAPFIKPPESPGASYEASLVYMAIAILFFVIGPGNLSLDFLLTQIFNINLLFGYVE